jgi:hypothetical protein
MRVVSSKSRPSRAMRVATVFTGVAACTVGVTQAAQAQGIRPEAGAGPATGVRPAGYTYGSIRDSSNCAAQGKDKNWLHVSATEYWSWGYSYNSVCFGYKGAYSSPPFTGARAECGGNNHGYLLGTKNGGYASFWYGAGTTYHGLDWSHLYEVYISGWAGADACGIAPDHGGGCAGTCPPPAQENAATLGRSPEH